MITTIEKAVQVLNAKRYQESNGAFNGLRTIEDAIAIANWLTVQEVIEPFVKVANRLSDLRPETEWPYPDGILVRGWRRLAEYGGEK